MRKLYVAVYSLILFFSLCPFQSLRAETQASPTKEWTFLIYLNGNNNLDRFGDLNINQMEEVGSTDKINIIVQRASIRSKQTQRMLIAQDKNSTQITSPVLQSLDNVDMGDWRSLVDFVKWGVENYPAQRYFIDVWNHGSGWRAPGMKLASLDGIFPSLNPQIMDISFDDKTSNAISTEQLGLAMAESAKIIGHKVDLYASDACLMAMVEVADQLSDSVEIFGGSEELEPGAGWPYHKFLQRWTARASTSAAELGVMLTEEYVKSYSAGGVYGPNNATFSVFDLSKMSGVTDAMSAFGKEILRLGAESKKKVAQSVLQTQTFAYSDYADLLDFLKKIESAKIEGLGVETLDPVRAALSPFILANRTTPLYTKAQGAAIWLPRSMSTYNKFRNKYESLTFHAKTGWGEVARFLLN